MSEWISVEERLPDVLDPVAIWNGIEVVLGYWSDSFEEFRDQLGPAIGKITHWMPLPEPPKGT